MYNSNFQRYNFKKDSLSPYHSQMNTYQKQNQNFRQSDLLTPQPISTRIPSLVFQKRQSSVSSANHYSHRDQQQSSFHIDLTNNNLFLKAQQNDNLSDNGQKQIVSSRSAYGQDSDRRYNTSPRQMLVQKKIKEVTDVGDKIHEAMNIQTQKVVDILSGRQNSGQIVGGNHQKNSSSSQIQKTRIGMQGLGYDMKKEQQDIEKNQKLMLTGPVETLNESPINLVQSGHKCQFIDNSSTKNSQVILQKKLQNEEGDRVLSNPIGAQETASLMNQTNNTLPPLSLQFSPSFECQKQDIDDQNQQDSEKKQSQMILIEDELNNSTVLGQTNRHVSISRLGIDDMIELAQNNNKNTDNKDYKYVYQNDETLKGYQNLLNNNLSSSKPSQLQDDLYKKDQTKANFQAEEIISIPSSNLTAKRSSLLGEELPVQRQLVFNSFGPTSSQFQSLKNSQISQYNIQSQPQSQFQTQIIPTNLAVTGISQAEGTVNQSAEFNFTQKSEQKSPSTNMRYNQDGSPPPTQSADQPKQILEMQNYIDEYNSNKKQSNSRKTTQQATDSVRKIEPHFQGQKINFNQIRCDNSSFEEQEKEQKQRDEETPGLGVEFNMREKSEFSQLSEQIIIQERQKQQQYKLSQQNCGNEILGQDQQTIPDRLSSSVGSPIKRASQLSHPMVQTFDPQKQNVAVSFEHTQSPTPMVLLQSKHNFSDKLSSRFSASNKGLKSKATRGSQLSSGKKIHAFQGIISSNDPTINLSKQTGRFSSAKNMKLQTAIQNIQQKQQVPSQNYNCKDVRYSDSVNIASKIPTPNPPTLQERESSSTTTRSIQHESIKLMPKNNTDDDQDKLSIQQFHQSDHDQEADNKSLQGSQQIRRDNQAVSMHELKQVISETKLNKRKIHSTRQSNVSEQKKIISSSNPPKQISLSLVDRSNHQIDDQIIVNYDCSSYNQASEKQLQHFRKHSKKQESLNSQYYARPLPAQSPIIPESELSGPSGHLYAINPSHPNLHHPNHKRRISSSIIGAGQNLQLFDKLNISEDGSKYDSLPPQTSNRLIQNEITGSQKQLQFNKLINLNNNAITSTYPIRTQNTQDLFISQLVPADQGEITPQPQQTPQSPSKQPPISSIYPNHQLQHHENSIINTYTLSGSNLQIDQMTMTQTPLFEPINYNYSAIQSQVRYQYFENTDPYQANPNIQNKLIKQNKLTPEDAVNNLFFQNHEAIFRSQLNDVPIQRGGQQLQESQQYYAQQNLLDTNFEGFVDDSPFFDQNIEQSFERNYNNHYNNMEEEEEKQYPAFPRQMNGNSISKNQAKLMAQHPFYEREWSYEDGNKMMMMINNASNSNKNSKNNNFLNADINEEDKFSPANEDDEDDYNMMIQENQEIIEGYPLQQQQNQHQQQHQYGLRPYYPNNQDNQQYLDVSNAMIGGTGVGEVTEVAEQYEDESDFGEDDMRKQQDATAEDLNEAIGINGLDEQDYQDQEQIDEEDEQQNYAPSCQEGIAFNGQEVDDEEDLDMVNHQELKKQEQKYLQEHNLISNNKNEQNNSQVFDPNNESSYIFNDSQIIAGGGGTSQNFVSTSAIDILNGKQQQQSIPPTPPHYSQYNQSQLHQHSQQHSHYESGRSSAGFIQGQGNPRQYSSNIKRSVKGSRIQDSQYFSNQYVSQSNRMSFQQDQQFYSKSGYGGQKKVKEHRFMLDEDQNGENYSLEGLEQWLQKINLQFLAPVLSEGGFDDIQALIAQMKSSMPVTDEMLRKINIEKPGHRARILVKLEEQAGMAPDASVLSARRNSAFGTGEIPAPSSSSSGLMRAFQFCTKPQKNPIVMFQMSTLKQWLHMLRLQSFHHQFVVAGYENFEFMLKQMNSNNPITDSILKNEIGIQKLGHRTRILYKLHQDAYLYKQSKMQATMKKKDRRGSSSRLSNAKSIDIITQDIPRGQEEACKKCQIF